MGRLHLGTTQVDRTVLFRVEDIRLVRLSITEHLVVKDLAIWARALLFPLVARDDCDRSSILTHIFIVGITSCAT